MDQNEPSIVVGLADESDLQSILDLQQLSLKKNVSPEKAALEGFLTVEHTPEQLQAMHREAPSVIIKVDSVLAAYALTMTVSCSRLIPVLAPMFEHLSDLEYRGVKLNEMQYYVMGQICVGEPYRKKGLFRWLYTAHRDFYEDQFEALVTEVSVFNQRSMTAHLSIGFEEIEAYADETGDWKVLLWGWKVDPEA